MWAIERTGREAAPILTYSERFGRYPGAVALFAFVSLELAHPVGASLARSPSRSRSTATGLSPEWRCSGATWTRGGEGSAVAFGLLASQDRAVRARDGSLVVRWPSRAWQGSSGFPARSSSSR